ncbi:MAG: PepSY-associated TM helix domain-containing protein [Amaricoccus sp.]|uniref:PepSY-associated TM helix domain-containing protein n=1 Tax=Amaricoccus sp. TaxID=1872485 RepID=UPI0039E726F7
MVLGQIELKRLTAIHGWSAVILGLLLYVVVATGAVAVFAEEIGRWSAGDVRAAAPMEQPVDATLRRLARQVDPENREDVGIWGGEGRDLFLFFHTHKTHPESGELEEFGTIFRADSITGQAIDRHDGFVWRDAPAWEDSALRRFLVDLHVQLYLPSPWGLYLTGVLGLMMMAAVVSGVLMHRHVIRDLFVAERSGGRLVGARDRHALSSSWSIPFAFLLAFTGSFFSFAGTVGFPIVATVAFGGDQEALSATLFEPPVPEDATPSTLANLNAMISDSRARSGGAPTFVDVSHFGRADARVTVWHDPSDGGMIYPVNHYDGTTGVWLGAKSTLGNGPSLGSTLYGLMYPLHFGHFAGLFSKVVWGALGVTMCVVILSGFRLWVRRREGDPAWRRFGQAVQIVGYGLPVGMLVAGFAFFLTRPALDPFFWTPLGFVLGVAVAVALGVRVPDERRYGTLAQRLLGTLCLILPVLRLATGGMDWATALLHGQTDVVTVDLLLLVAGASLWWFARPTRTVARLLIEPAE